MLLLLSLDFGKTKDDNWLLKNKLQLKTKVSKVLYILLLFEHRLIVMYMHTCGYDLQHLLLRFVSQSSGLDSELCKEVTTIPFTWNAISHLGMSKIDFFQGQSPRTRP